MVRLIHTADWQLGKPFAFARGDAGALLREARFEAVEKIGRLAAEHRADAVLVAGDAFDSNDVSDATIHKALQAMGSFRGPWVMLPGNHDAALAECVWTRLERLGRPENLMLAAEPAGIELGDGRAVILPAPLVARRTYDDLTAWMDDAATPDGTIRVGLAHGSVAARLPQVADATNPIAQDRADRARLDYLALGDWHGAAEIAPRTWYSGTPEPDRFKAKDAGHVLLVEIGSPRGRASVRKLRTGRYDWRSLSVRLDGQPDPGKIVDKALSVLGDPARALVELSLEGGLGLAARAALDLALDRWSARLCHLRPDDSRLLVAADLMDFVRLGDGGVTGAVARRLAELARDGPTEQRDHAELALRHLWGLLGQVSSG